MGEEILRRKTHPEQGFRSGLGVLRLAKRYGAPRVEGACRRARALAAPSYRSVQSILKTGLDRQPVAPLPPSAPAVPEHEHIRGPQYYERKELA